MNIGKPVKVYEVTPEEVPEDTPAPTEEVPALEQGGGNRE